MLLNDSEIIACFISLLEKSDEMVLANPSADNKLKMTQLTLHIIKSVQFMINTGGPIFLQKMKDEGHLQKFVEYLYIK